jgi:hypothetical protein
VLPLTYHAGLSEGYTCFEKIVKSRLYQEKAELVQKQILPRAASEGITYNVVAKQK